MFFNIVKATKCKLTPIFYLIFKGSTRGVIGTDHVMFLGLCCLLLQFGLENYTFLYVWSFFMLLLLSADFSNFF